MSYYSDDDDTDDDVIELSLGDFTRSLTGVRSDRGETDFSIIDKDDLGDTLHHLNIPLNKGMVDAFWQMIAANANDVEARQLPVHTVYSSIDAAATGQYKGMPLNVSIGGLVQEFKSSTRGRKLKHQKSLAVTRESAKTSREHEKRRMAELRAKREEQARIRAEQEEIERKAREEQQRIEEKQREDEARLLQLRREEELREEQARQMEEEKRRLKIRAARERAASIDPTPKSPRTPHGRTFDASRPETYVRQRRSSITKLRDDQLVTSVGPIRGSSPGVGRDIQTRVPNVSYSKRMSGAPMHVVDPSNIPSYEEKENEMHPRKGGYDKTGPSQMGGGLLRSGTPPQGDHLFQHQHQHTTSSHDRDEIPYRSGDRGVRNQQPYTSSRHHRENSKQSVHSVSSHHNRQNTNMSTATTTASVSTATSGPNGSAPPPSGSASTAGENLRLNPAQMQTLHRVHAELEYLQQMERDRWRQQNMLIDALRDTDSWKEISSSVVESKLNNLKKDLSDMFEAQSLASAHRVSSDLSRELRSVKGGLVALGERIERNSPQQDLLENLLNKVNSWTELLEERWAVLDVNKYSRAQLSESHEEFRGEVLSSLDWVMTKSRETRRIVNDQIAGDIGNKVLQLLDAFKITKDGQIKFESDPMPDDEQLVVPVSHVTGLIEKHQQQHNEELAVLNQRINALQSSVDEYESKEKGWNTQFRALRSENRDLVLETERLRARLMVVEAEMQAKDAIEKAKAKATLTERQQEIQNSLDDREEKLLEAEDELHRERNVFDERFEMWEENRRTFETMVENHLENAKELTQNAKEYNEAIENESDAALDAWAYNNKVLKASSRSLEKKLKTQERELKQQFEKKLQKALKLQYEKFARAGRIEDDDFEDDEKATVDDVSVETDGTGKVLTFQAERKRFKSDLRKARESATEWQRKCLDVEQQLITARDQIIHLQKGIDSRNNVTTDMLVANIDLNVLKEQKRRLIKRLQTIYRTHLKYKDQFDLDDMYKSRRVAELDKLRKEVEHNRQLMASADNEMRRGLRFLYDPEQISNMRHQGMAGILQLIHVDRYDMRNVCLMGARFLIGIFAQLYAVGHRQIDPKMLYNAYRVTTVTFDSFQAQKGGNMDEAVVTFGREAIEQYKWWRVWTHEWQQQTNFSQTFIGCLNRPKSNPRRPEESYQPQTLEHNGQQEVSFYRTPGMFFEGRIIANSAASRFNTRRRRRDRDRDANGRDTVSSNAGSTAPSAATTPNSSVPSTPNRQTSSSSQRHSRKSSNAFRATTG